MENDNTQRCTRLGITDASAYAKAYRIKKNCNDMLIIDELERLDLAGKTYSSGFVMIVLCRSGHVDFVMNECRHRLSKDGLLVSFGVARLSDIVMSPDFNGVALVESHEFMQETLLTMKHLWPYLLYIIDNPVIELGEMELKRVTANYQMIIDRLKNEDHHFRREATIANLQACYLDVCDLLDRRAPKNNEMPPRSYGIFDQFLRLMANNYVEHRDVKWYADEMRLTPKYLSEIVKEVSGRTASLWISAFVVTEVKSLLRESDLSIKEIAVEMNFANQSFLGKYFKNATGMSPVEYRNML